MIFIAGSKLKALMRFAGDKDVRYYLNGIYFDPAGFAVATDGHRLMAVHIEPFAAGVPGFIVPRAVVEAALKRQKGMAKYRYTFGVDALTFDGVSYTPIDGRYPDWQRVVATTPNGEHAEYNCQYLEDARKAIEDLREGAHVQTVFMARNGREPGLVKLVKYKEAANAYMCIMAVVGDSKVGEVSAHAAKFMEVRS